MYAAKKKTAGNKPVACTNNLSECVMMKPEQLIETGSSKDELNLIGKTLKLIESDNRPVTVITIIGPSRSGKSFLMNRLMGKNDGFPLGSTVCAKTKGFWLWHGNFPGDPKRSLVLLDVEGLGDPKKFNQGTHDLKLFTLALLSSSLFIYNTMGNIDASALDGLHLASQIAEEMTSKDHQSECAEFGVHFPHLVWVIRDQFLELKNENGNILTPKELLEDRLQPMKVDCNASVEIQNKVEEYNDSRNLLREFFPTRDCFIFPRPVSDDEQMRHLDELDDSELNPNFKNAADDFVKFTFKAAKNKNIEGSSLTGPAYAKLFQQLLESVNSKNVSIKSTYQMIAQEENQKAVHVAVKKFEEIFSNVKFPISAEKFATLSKEAQEGGHKEFLDNCIAIKANPQYLEELTSTFNELVIRKERENYEASAKVCKKMLNQMFQSIENKTESYLVDGGYNFLKQDIDEIKLNFEMQNEHLGPAKYDVLQEFQKEKFLPLIKHVFESDKFMTELKKKEAEAQQRAEDLKAENERIEAEIKKKEAEAEAARLAAETNLKNMIEKMEEQHAEKTEQLKNHLKNQEIELERIKKDANANAEWKKECEEMLKKQKKESEENEKKHQEDIRKLKEDAEKERRDRKDAEDRMKRMAEEQMAFAKEKNTAAIIGATTRGLGDLVNTGLGIYKACQKYGKK